MGVMWMLTVECVILSLCPPYLELDGSLSFLRRHISLLFRQFPFYCSVMNLVAHPVGDGTFLRRYFMENMRILHSESD